MNVYMLEMKSKQKPAFPLLNPFEARNSHWKHEAVL